MDKEQFEKLLHDASHEFAGKKKAPTTPQKQFEKGARWLWDLLMESKDVIYYEAMLRADLIDREGEVKRWKESLITDTAVMMADRDDIMNEIKEYGRMVEKHDKNGFSYYESNPLYVHLKEKERSIGMQREHLGLTNKSNPERMKANPKNEVDEDDPTVIFYKNLRK